MSAESRLGRFLGRVRSFVSREPAQVESSDEPKESLPDWYPQASLKALTEGKQVVAGYMDEDSEKPVMFVDGKQVEFSGSEAEKETGDDSSVQNAP